jgi:AcrR family transcriptional regulator
MAPPPAAPSGRAGRPYQSPRRARAAAETRAAILAAAMRLFLERGYGRVTIADIAGAAATAVPTVYASTGGKSAILAALIDQSERDPVVEATFAAIRQSRTPQEAIEATAHGVRVDNERYHDLIQVMVTAATLDDTATATLVASDRRYRQALARTADRLRELGALRPGMTPERAVDILWFHLGHEAWHLLVADRGWSWDDAEAWLAEQASAALLDPAP